MANSTINKLVYFGETLFDLTADDVTPADVKSGIMFHGRDGESYIGTNTDDANTQDATATAAQILDKQTAYVKGRKLTGTMANRGAVAGSISTKDGQYTVPVGYHDGSGKVGIAEAEQAKIVESNIREGVTILGVTGTMSGSEAERPYDLRDIHSTTVSHEYYPSDFGDYTCFRSVRLDPIPFSESDNEQGGVTVIIGSAEVIEK